MDIITDDRYVLCITPQMFCMVYGQHHRHYVRSMDNTTDTVRLWTTPQKHCMVYGQHHRHFVHRATNTLYGLWTTPQTLCTVYEQHRATNNLYGLWTTPCRRHFVRSMATPHSTVYGQHRATDTLYGLWQHHTLRSMTTPEKHQKRSQWVQRARGKPEYSKIMAVHKTSTSPSLSLIHI